MSDDIRRAALEEAIRAVESVADGPCENELCDHMSCCVQRLAIKAIRRRLASTPSQSPEASVDNPCIVQGCPKPRDHAEGSDYCVEHEPECHMCENAPGGVCEMHGGPSQSPACPSHCSLPDTGDVSLCPCSPGDCRRCDELRAAPPKGEAPKVKCGVCDHRRHNGRCGIATGITTSCPCGDAP